MPKGGARKGAGRKKAVDEISAVTKATALSPKAWETLETECENGNLKAAELILAYAHGKPSQSMDITSGGKEIPTPILGLKVVPSDNGNKANHKSKKAD